MLDYEPKHDKDAIQSMVYKYFFMNYEPITKGKGKVTLVMNVKKDTSILPDFLVRMIVVKFAMIFFEEIISISNKFKESKWE